MRAAGFHGTLLPAVLDILATGAIGLDDWVSVVALGDPVETLNHLRSGRHIKVLADPQI
jgi:hypothetical protein